jgi:SSS family solute:Na+ symporter
VWTYDIYRPIHRKFASTDGTDAHFVKIGRWTTIIGVFVSIGTAYLVQQFASIMDYVQALFSFFVAPLFGTVILGMLWKRATKQGGFYGLLAGTISSIGMWAWVKMDPSALRIIALSADAKDMAENMYRALWSWSICVIITVVVSLMTKAKPESELNGLVRSCTELPSEGHLPFYQRPIFFASIVFAVFIAFNIIFW